MESTQNIAKNYLNELNEVQRAAVIATEGPVLVIAGPGSGKTRVLTYRIAHIIEKGVAPWEILSLTFTNKAAREMKERIAKVVGSRVNDVWAGTFHSIFSRILRVEAEKIGYSSNFTIYDTEDSKNVLSNIIKEMQLDKKLYNVNAIRARISSAKSNLIPPRAYAQDKELMLQDKMSKRPWIHKIYEEYEKKCKRSGAMDFDDLLFRLFELLYKNPDKVVEKYRKKFKYVLVDEFQDTNYLQYRIIKKLIEYPNSPRNICVVGDDAQSIYGFRGATIQNILDFEKDFKKHGIQIFKLEQNYRSTYHIVEAANQVISHNARQIQKKIWSHKGVGQRIKVIKAMTDSEECKRVADTIVEQKNRYHLSNKDIAILYRTNAQSRGFEEYLRRYNLSYKVFGSISFYQRKEIKDLVAYLRLAINPNDDEALRRVINYPKRAIGQTSLDKIVQHATQNEQTLWKALPQVALPARTKKSIKQFIALVESFQTKAQTGTAYEAAIYIAKKSKLVDTLKADTSVEGMGRMENLHSLLDGINEFVEDDIVSTEGIDADKSLATYLQNIALLTDLDENSEEENFVTLMSVHSAKGLEFPSVFVVGMEEKLFPSFKSIALPEEIAEERRLFYVAITRAERFLTLTYSVNRHKFGEIRRNLPSRFLEEIPSEHLESNTTSVRFSSKSTFSQQKTSPSNERPRAKVSGNFKQTTNTQARLFNIDPREFKPSPVSAIQPGVRVVHLKFGYGKVITVDGPRDNKVATIHFKALDLPKRRIALKFTKLQVI